MRAALIIIFSLIMDILFGLCIGSWSHHLNFHLTLFSIVSIIYVYRYFENNLKVYFIISFLVGILYDLAITNTGVFTGLIYLAIAFITALVASYFKPHYLVNIILVIINITIYILISYLFLTFYDLYLFNWWQLLFGVLGSYLINLIYLTFLTIINPKKMNRNNYLKL